MGTEFYVVDTKNRRRLWLGKGWRHMRLSSERVPLSDMIKRCAIAQACGQSSAGLCLKVPAGRSFPTTFEAATSSPRTFWGSDG